MISRSQNIPPAVADRPRPGRSRRVLWSVVSLTGAVLLGFAALVSERTGSGRLRARQLAAAVPAMPDLGPAPTELGERMRNARAQALVPATEVAGLAEFGRLCHANFHAAEAEACWRLLAAAEPRAARWTYYVADLRGMASDATGMEQWLGKTTELAPDYAPAWLRLGDLQFKTGQLAAAEHAYRRRLALIPNDPYASLGLARIALQRGLREEALTLIAHLVATVPDFPSAHNLYAEMLSAQGDGAGAARERSRGGDGRFREADDPWLDELMDWCFTYDRLCVRGTAEVLTKHADRGEAWFTRAILIEPDRLTAYELLGNLWIDRNEPAKAREIYLAGLRRAGAGRAAKIYVSLSRADRMLHQPAEAARIVREGLQAAGDDAELYHELGLALGEQGENDAAVDALHQAVVRNTTDARSNYDLAMALIAVHRLDDAIQALHQSLTLEPTYPATLSLLAQIEIDSGRWRDAEQYLRPLYDAHPELPEAKAQMAGYYLRCGVEAEQNRDLAAAEQSYRRGLAVDANDAELQGRLGVLCLVQRRFADSVPPLEAYHQLQPHSPQASLFLGQAYLATGRRTQARQVLAQAMRDAQEAGDGIAAQHAREMLQRIP